MFMFSSKLVTGFRVILTIVLTLCYITNTASAQDLYSDLTHLLSGDEQVLIPGDMGRTRLLVESRKVKILEKDVLEITTDSKLKTDGRPLAPWKFVLFLKDLTGAEIVSFTGRLPRQQCYLKLSFYEGGNCGFLFGSREIASRVLAIFEEIAKTSNARRKATKANPDDDISLIRASVRSFDYWYQCWIPFVSPAIEKNMGESRQRLREFAKHVQKNYTEGGSVTGGVDFSSLAVESYVAWENEWYQFVGLPFEIGNG